MSVRFDEIFTLRVVTADEFDDLANIACVASPLDLQSEYIRRTLEMHATDVQDSAEDTWKRHQHDHYSNRKRLGDGSASYCSGSLGLPAEQTRSMFTVGS